ncbi:type II secretion system protein GspG [Pseudomonas sp. JM0905a]|nr:type II secretion system protein GspG [Pseudomonas sp. JM0905a]
MKTFRRPEPGFTLLDVLVVGEVLGLLARIVAPKYFNRMGNSETRVARAQIEALVKALDIYRLEMAVTPAPSRARGGPASMLPSPGSSP